MSTPEREGFFCLLWLWSRGSSAGRFEKNFPGRRFWQFTKPLRSSVFFLSFFMSSEFTASYRPLYRRVCQGVEYLTNGPEENGKRNPATGNELLLSSAGGSTFRPGDRVFSNKLSFMGKKEYNAANSFIFCLEVY